MLKNCNTLLNCINDHCAIVTIPSRKRPNNDGRIVNNVKRLINIFYYEPCASYSVNKAITVVTKKTRYLIADSTNFVQTLILRQFKIYMTINMLSILQM